MALRTVESKSPTDQQCHACLRASALMPSVFGPGCNAGFSRLEASTAHRPGKQEYTIINGSDGYIELPFSSGGFDAMLYDVNRNLVEHYHDEWPHGFKFEIEEVVRCIREGRITSDVMPPEDTIACAKVFEKVLRD